MQSKLEEIYESGQVQRYHANPRMASLGQTTADHSWGVAALILKLNPLASRELITVAIFHDSGERWCGDLPHPFKVAFPRHADTHNDLERRIAGNKGVPQPTLTNHEKKWLKLADRLESQLYAKLHRPDVFQSWGKQEDILQLAKELNVSHEVQQMIGGS